jgi:hypothetical protein
MGMLRTLALGVVGFGLYSTLRKRSRMGDTAVKPEPLQRWEGEGGNVPQAHPGLHAAEVGDDAATSSASARSAKRSKLS